MMAAAAELVIRPIRREDHDSWMPLWRGYQEFYKVDLAEEVSATTFARLLDPAEPVNGSLAWQGPRAVGMVHYIPHRSTWTIGNYCYLQDLFTAPDLRGGGVGRKLIEHVYEVAKQAGCARVYWLTHESNATAMKLYDRVADKPGFVQYRRVL
jgi:GNAT superfamily N-acetyltransferase